MRADVSSEMEICSKDFLLKNMRYLDRHNSCKLTSSYLLDSTKDKASDILWLNSRRIYLIPGYEEVYMNWLVVHEKMLEMASKSCNKSSIHM